MIPFKKYYNLTKPGIIYGNLLSVIAGYFLASRWHFDWRIFIGVMLGTAFVIGSGCVFNNYIDRDIDKKMLRTSKRSLAIGEIPPHYALLYATALGLLGFLCLILLTNLLTMVIGLIGFGCYVIVYGIAKRTSIYSTLIGSIPGAMPIVAGYTAVTNRFDVGALLLFLILASWQMPHFYAIGIRRLEDYTEAGLKIWPVIRGVQQTKIQILIFICIFTISVILLFAFHYTGLLYLIVMLCVCGVWLYRALQGFRATDNTIFAKKLFLFSLITLLVLCATIALNPA